MSNSKITKNDLVDSIYQNSSIEKQVILEIVDSFISQVKLSLENGASIELRGFGTFEPKLRNGRSVARNPKTGETFTVEPHYIASFRAGQDLKAKLWNLKIDDEK